jgi:hypothetical protein
VAIGTVEEIIERAKASNLEEAFITFTGGIQEKELLAWREEKDASA